MPEPIDRRALVRRERRPFLLAGVAATLLTALLQNPWLLVVVVILTGWVFWFFRDPERAVPPGERDVVAPADGRVVEIARVKEGRFLNEERLRVSIFLNVFNVHVNRTPAAGVVRQTLYRPGQFVAAQRAAASEVNEQNAVLLELPTGERLVFVQIAGLIARRIVSWVQPGDALGKGERFGMIRFGSRTDLYLPLETDLRVRVGQAVKGAETVMGVLP
jgi:phosphatidylserine decarboxylase